MTDKRQSGPGRKPARKSGQAPAPKPHRAAGRLPVQPDDRTPTQAQHEDHGHSVAAWTSVIIIMIGSLIATIAVIIGSTAVFVVGIVIAVLGGVAAKVLSAMGFGSASGSIR